MNHTNFNLTLRSLKKNLLYSVLVIMGLTVGITTFISTLQWSSWHLTFDRSYKDYDQIYRLTLEESAKSFYRHMARVIHGDIINSITFSDAFSEIDKIGRLSPYRKAIVKLDEDEFYENFAFSCDREWLEIFSPTVLIGSPENLLTEPGTAVITESISKKYFGSNNPVGKSIEIIHQFDVNPVQFTITSVIADFPENSHLKIAVLTSFDNPIEFDGTAWTYVKLIQDASPAILENNLKLYLESNFEEAYIERMMPRLQPIKDIHLHSHKPREIVPNVQYKSVIILLITGMFVFILSWFNFTLLTVSQNQLNIKRLVIQWQMGSGKRELFNQFLTNFIIVGCISMISGILLTLLLKNTITDFFGQFIFHDFRIFVLIIIILIVLLLCSSIITAFYSTHRLYRYLKFKYLSAKSAVLPDAALKNRFIRWAIIAEFVITFILISNLFLIQRQINYATSMQMGANDPTTIQIPNLHRKVIDQYPVFREKILESPLFSNVTGTMEEPTGLTMDAVKFSIDGYNKTEEQLFLFPAEENFIRFYNIEMLYGDDLPVNYNPSDTVEYFILNETAARMIAGVNIESLIGRRISLDFFYPDIIGSGIIGGISKDFYLSGLDYEISPM